MFKRTIAYVEGNSCRDVESIHFENNAALFEKAFALVCFVVLAETMYLCRTLGELLRMHSGCFCYRGNNVWLWKEWSQKAHGQDLVLAPAKRAFFNIEISSVLVPGNFRWNPSGDLLEIFWELSGSFLVGDSRRNMRREPIVSSS